MQRDPDMEYALRELESARRLLLAAVERSRNVLAEVDARRAGLAQSHELRSDAASDDAQDQH